VLVTAVFCAAAKQTNYYTGLSHKLCFFIPFLSRHRVTQRKQSHSHDWEGAQNINRQAMSSTMNTVISGNHTSITSYPDMCMQQQLPTTFYYKLVLRVDWLVGV